MAKKAKKWSLELLLSEARKYGSKREMSTNSESAYRTILRMGDQFKEAAFSHMTLSYCAWSDEELFDEAKKHRTKKSLRDGNPKVYWAIHRKTLDFKARAFEHMDCLRVSWSDASLEAELSKYSSVSDLKRDNINAYWAVINRGPEFRKSAIGRMRRNHCGFSVMKPGHLYVFEVALSDGRRLYKVGVTNRSPNLRKNEYGVKSCVESVTLIHSILFDDGEIALAEESAAKEKFKEFRYAGPRLFANGNTELFTVNPLVS